MKKQLLTVAATAMMSMGLAAQNVIETSATVGNLTVPACSVTLQKDPKMVQDAMVQYLKDARLKAQKDDQGYLMVPNAFIEEIAISNINFYTKVDAQGKKKNREAVVTVCVLSSDLTVDPTTLRNNAKRWLSGFVTYVDRYEAGLQMQAEQQNLKKAEKDAAKAAKAVEAIDKSVARDQKKIADKEKEIKKYQQKIKECENDIKNLRANIEKTEGKRASAEQDVEEAKAGVSRVQGEVERYRQLSE